MAEVGFILVGILLGACLISLFSLWIYHQTCLNYVERKTGVVWHLKTVAADAFSGKAVYIMQSTKTAEVLAMNMQDFNSRFMNMQDFNSRFRQ